jgi:hypothetical protein
MHTILKITALTIFASVIIACKKDKSSPPELSPPELTTLGVSDITYTSAVSGGTVAIDNGTNLISKGVCWNISGNPTIADSKTDDGTQIGSFNSSISPLLINTKYYVRAFATNNIGTSYGNEQTFTTLNPKLFIRAKFGSEMLECYYSLETVNNYYTYFDNPGQNRFYLKMHNNPDYVKSKEIQIDINRINIDTLRTPWENEAIPGPKTYISLYMVNLKRASNLFGIYDSINYSGSQLFEDPVFVAISKISGDTIQGTFHGTLNTKTGLSKQMTNGEFKIKFHRINESWN